MTNQFNILAWSKGIPLCDDVWLGMQARNIAIVDFAIIRDMEDSALAAYLERGRTPMDILLPLSALSQMWVFSLYEFLRTWRQRARELISIANGHISRPEAERNSYLAAAVKKAEEKEKYIRLAPRFHSEHVAQLADPQFAQELKDYYGASEGLFFESDALRVTLAKHEVPKASPFIAEAPGYGRMSYSNGSMYWFVTLKDGSQISVERRDLSNAFFGIDDMPI